MPAPGIFRHVLRVVGVERSKLTTSFAPNGAGAVDQTTIRGKDHVTSVTRTAAGEFDLVFADKWVEKDFTTMLGCVREHGVPTGLKVVFGDYTASTKTLHFYLCVGAVLTDLAANAQSRVSLEFTFRARGQDT